MSRADELLAAANPVTAPLPDEVVESALRRVLARAAAERPMPAPRRARSRRARVLLAVTVTVAASAFTLVSVLPAGRAPDAVGTAWTQNVIRRAYAVLADAGAGVLYVQMTVHQAFPNANAGKGVYDDYTVESWTELGGTQRYWTKVTSAAEPNDEVPLAADTNWTVAADGQETSFDQNSNTITVTTGRATRLPGTGAAPVDPATLALASGLPLADAKRTLRPADRDHRLTFSDLLRQLITSHGATVEGPVSLDGVPAIRLSAQNGVMVYVDQKSYRPLEIDTNQAPDYTATIKIGAYETLPAGAATAPDLPALHPSAKVIQTQNSVQSH
jgi:hypothetical protein